MVLKGLLNYLGPGPLPLYLLKRKSSPLLSLIQSKKAVILSEKEACEFWATSAPIGPLLVQPLAMLTQDMDASACVLQQVE